VTRRRPFDSRGALEPRPGVLRTLAPRAGGGRAKTRDWAPPPRLPRPRGRSASPHDAGTPEGTDPGGARKCLRAARARLATVPRFARVRLAASPDRGALGCDARAPPRRAETVRSSCRTNVFGRRTARLPLVSSRSRPHFTDSERSPKKKPRTRIRPTFDSGLDGQSSLGRTRVRRFAKRNGSGVWRASRSSRLLPVTRHAPLARSSTRSLPPSSISCSSAFSPTSSSCARAFGRTRRGRSPRSRRRRTPRTSPPPRRTRTPSPRAPPRAPSYPRRRCCSRRTGRRWT